jgi:hypothetical protein
MFETNTENGRRLKDRFWYFGRLPGRSDVVLYPAS